MAVFSRSLAAVCLSLTIAFGHLALHAQEEKKDDAKTEHKDEKQTPVPPESTTVTHHVWKAAGTPVSYTATAGNLVIHDDDDKPYGSVFYAAYTEDGANESTRPVTFLYNGGPGIRDHLVAHGFRWASACRDREPRCDWRAALQAGSE